LFIPGFRSKKLKKKQKEIYKNKEFIKITPDDHKVEEIFKEIGIE
jgi:hypothetical protein